MLKSVVISPHSLSTRWKETDPARRHKRILIFVLLVLHVLPLWIFTYFPSQDGPAHIYNAYVLKVFHEADEGSLMRQYYQLNLTLFPNWFSHAFMMLLMYIVPPLVAEKILLSLIIVLFPLSLFYFLDATHKGKNLYGFLGFLFSYHYLLHMGFYSFSISVPVFFFALGYFVKHKEEMSLNNIAILNLLCLLTYFCHILSYGLLIFSLILLSIISSYHKPRRVIALLLCMLPLIFLMANYLLSNSTGQSGSHFGLSQIWERFSSKHLWSYLLSTKSLMYFTDYHLIITRLMLVMLGALFIATLYSRIRQRRIVSKENQFLLIFAIVTAIYFIMPSGMMSGGWINDRINLFIFPLLLPFLQQDFHRYIKRGLVIVMVTFALAHLALSCRYYYPWDKIMKEYTSATKMIEKNKAVLGLFDDRSPGVKEAPPFTHDEFVEPFTQITSYYCLGNGGVDLVNYEAKYNYFPVNWKDERPGIIDYIVTWKLGETQPPAYNLQTDYDLIHSTENLKLYRHKTEKSSRTKNDQ